MEGHLRSNRLGLRAAIDSLPRLAPLIGGIMNKIKYRVVTDHYCGFEAQYRVWWWPFWMMVNGCNTRSTLEDAKGLCGKDKVVWSSQEDV